MQVVSGAFDLPLNIRDVGCSSSTKSASESVWGWHVRLGGFGASLLKPQKSQHLQKRRLSPILLHPISRRPDPFLRQGEYKHLTR